MVVFGLFVVLVVSIAVAYFGVRYSDGTSPARRASTAGSGSTIDLTDAHEGAAAPPMQEWAARGFDADSAASWIDHGFDADHAFLFRSLDIDAGTVARLRSTGLEDSALVSLLEEASFAHHDGRAQLVAVADEAPELALQALAWLRLGASTEQSIAYAREGFTPAASDTWRAAGWHLDDALPWFAARFEPTPARAWRDNGFEPAEADAWRRDHFGLRHAIEWRRLDPGETRRWLQAGVRDASKATALRARGYRPDDMAYAAVLTRDDLLSAAREIADAGGGAEVVRRLQAAATNAGRVGDVGMSVVEDVLHELQRLLDSGQLRDPTSARALARRFERGLLVAAQTQAN